MSNRPKQLGSFEVLREIGQGGMGVVYLARQPALDRLVVLKKIRRELVADSSMLKRFQREARAAAAIHHQNVVAVYDCFETRGTHYIAQELVNGADLKGVLDRNPRIEPRIAALMILEMARGLEEIHARGIVHRDLKPANVLLGAGGEVKIADFGIALEGCGDALTRPGTMIGSLPYMSPEQMLGENVDYRSDVFLLGVLLYEMLVGEPPYRESDGESTDTLLERMQSERYRPARRRQPGVPRRVDRLLRGCLRGRPAKRVGSATAVRRRLERWLGRVSAADSRLEIADWLWRRELLRPIDETTALRPVPAPLPTRGAWPRRLVPAAAAAAVLAAAGVAAIVGNGGASNPIPPAPATNDASPTDVEASFNGEDPGETSTDSRTLSPPWSLDATQAPGLADTSEGPPVEAVRAGAEAPSPAATLGPSGDAPPAVVAPEPAQVRFVAWPWAEVQVDDEIPFLTPRAEPLALTPGRHRVIFAHPTLGRVEQTVELLPGEERVVLHRYEEAEPS